MSGGTRQGLGYLVGAWYLAGAVLAIAVLTKGHVDHLAARTGYSTAAVILLGFAVVAGARFALRPGYAGLFGALTVLVTTSTFFLVAVEIWSKDWLRQSNRTLVMVLISILLGTACLILDSEREDDEDGIRLARGAAVAGLAALGVLTVFSATGTDVSPRLYGLACTLFLVPTISLPALRALGE